MCQGPDLSKAMATWSLVYISATHWMPLFIRGNQSICAFKAVEHHTHRVLPCSVCKLFTLWVTTTLCAYSYIDKSNNGYWFAFASQFIYFLPKAKENFHK